MEAVGKILIPMCAYGCLTGKRRCVYDSLTGEPNCVGGCLAGKPRFVYGSFSGKPRCLLPGFADINLKTHSSVGYFVCDQNVMYHTELLASKTRIAPMKAHTIPRLELISGRILVRLMASIKNALEAEVEITEIHYWLDSKTAFCWINNRGKWKQFVRH